MAEVAAFKFNKDEFEKTRDIYIGILECFEVENPEKFLQDQVAQIKDEEQNGEMFNKIVGSLFANKEDREYKAGKALENAKKMGKSPYIVAYLAEMADKYIPFDTVLTAGKIVGDGKSLQMGCGEGKTGVLSMAAYAKLAEGKQVFITSSTTILAAEGLDKLTFYDNVGVVDEVRLITPDGIVTGKIDEKTGRLMKDKDSGEPIKEKIDFEGKTEEEIKDMLAKAYECRLVFSDNVTLMQHAMRGYLQPNKNRELLADEADFVLLDSYRPLQQTAEIPKEEQEEIISQRKIAYNILEKVKNIQLSEPIYNIDDANQYVDFTNTGRKLIIDIINNESELDRDVDKNKIFDYVYDALVVDTVYKENRDYQILNGGKKIVSEDRASGVRIDLPEGVKQALEIKLEKEGKYTGEISEERKVLDTLNVQSFFGEFFGRKHFVSGTLGIDSDEIAKELEENFSISKKEEDIYDIPPRKARIREDQGKTIYSNNADKRKSIVDNAINEIGKGKPVLIGTVSEEEINELRQELESREFEDGEFPRILVYTAASEEIFQEDKKNLDSEKFISKYGVPKDQYKEYSDLIKIESGKKNVVTLGTSIIGRGTTIKTSKEINDNGGIHVIIDGLHETSSRNQEQYKARTARGTDKGTTIEFFSLEDIPEDYRMDYVEELENGPVDGARAEEIYKFVYEKIDNRTSSIRHYVNHFVECTRNNIMSIDEKENLNEQEKNEVKSLIAARAFSIKNRACGVSNKEEFKNVVKEYEEEIGIYRQMYIMKYIQREAGFDEIEWLKNNGYEEMAKRHIPFSNEREEEIFTLAGIRNQAEQSRQGKVQEATSATRESVIGEQTRTTQVKKEKDGGERDD